LGFLAEQSGRRYWESDGRRKAEKNSEGWLGNGSESVRETGWRLAITVYFDWVVELAKLVGGTKIRHWPKTWEQKA